MAESAESYGYDQPEDKTVLTQQPEVNTGGLPPYQPPPPQAGYSYPPVQQHSAHHSNTTTVVVQQPQMSMVRGPRGWNSGVCSCFDDMAVCCCGTFCGSCLASQVSQDMGEHMCVPCCVPGYLIALRLKMRTQENIDGTLMDDCCTVAWCGPCALCQLAREVHLVKTQRNMMAMPQTGTQY